MVGWRELAVRVRRWRMPPTNQKGDYLVQGVRFVKGKASQGVNP